MECEFCIIVFTGCKMDGSKGKLNIQAKGGKEKKR